MMDYSNGKNKDFILNFKEKNGKIIINFAHKLFKKNKLVIDKTLKNEAKILKSMENQVYKYYDNDTIIKKSKMYFLYIAFNIICIMISVIMLLTGATLSWLTLLGVSLTITGVCTYKCVKMHDWLKNNIFLLEQEKLNNSLKEHDSIIIDNIKDKTAKIIYDKSDKELNINDVDKLSYNELKQLLDAIKKMESFGFEESEGQIENGKRPKLELEQK